MELMGAIESGGLLDAEIQAILMRKKDKHAVEAANSKSLPGSEPSSSDSKELLHTQREIALDRYMVSASGYAMLPVVAGSGGNLSYQCDVDPLC